MERVPKDVRPTGHKIPSDPRKPYAETGIEPWFYEAFGHHDARPARNAFGLIAGDPAGALVVTRPQGVKLLGAEIKRHIRRRSFSAPCANALIEAEDWKGRASKRAKTRHLFVGRSNVAAPRRFIFSA